VAPRRRLGALLVAVTTAANAGVAPDEAGLAAGMLSASQQLGTASMGPADNVMGPGPRLLFRFFRTVAVPNLGRVGKDLQAMEDELAASGLDWHALRPVKLTDGPLTGNVRAGSQFAMKSVSRADVAWHILTLAEDAEPGPLRAPVITAASRHPRSDGTGSIARPELSMDDPLLERSRDQAGGCG